MSIEQASTPLLSNLSWRGRRGRVAVFLWPTHPPTPLYIPVSFLPSSPPPKMVVAEHVAHTYTTVVHAFINPYVKQNVDRLLSRSLNRDNVDDNICRLIKRHTIILHNDGVYYSLSLVIPNWLLTYASATSKVVQIHISPTEVRFRHAFIFFICGKSLQHSLSC